MVIYCVKGENLQGHESFIPTKLNPRLRELFNLYFTVIRPVEVFLASALDPTLGRSGQHAGRAIFQVDRAGPQGLLRCPMESCTEYRNTSASLQSHLQEVHGGAFSRRWQNTAISERNQLPSMPDHLRQDDDWERHIDKVVTVAKAGPQSGDVRLAVFLLLYGASYSNSPTHLTIA